MRIQEENIIDYLEQLRRKHAANLEEFVRKLINNLGQDSFNYLQPQTHLVKGCAHKEIPALAKRIEADLLVMGTVARTGVSGFTMGNTAEMILNQIDCSILAIKPLVP